MKEEFNSELGTIRYYLKDKNSEESTLLRGAYLFKDFNIEKDWGMKVLEEPN